MSLVPSTVVTNYVKIHTQSDADLQPRSPTGEDAC
jgi:hypothetical protein